MRLFGRVIASRQLSRRGQASPLTVEIGAPRRRRTGEWECPYRIRGLRSGRARRVLGEDAVQALELVFQVIRLELEPYGTDLSWTGEPGDTGFHRFFPDGLSVPMRRRIGRLIDRELSKEVQRELRRRRKLTRRKKRSGRAAT